MAWLPLFALPVLACALYPLIYLGYRQMLTYKRDEIISLMSKGKAFQRYLEAFTAGADGVPTNDKDQHKQLVSTVEGLFNAYYDWLTYLIPIVICMIFTFIAVSAALVRSEAPPNWLPHEVIELTRGLPPVALAAIAGAYVWGLYDMVDNFINLNLTPTQIHFVWLRLLIAPILGYLVGAPLNDSGKLMAGFAVGVFPLKQLLDFVQSRGAKLLNIDPAKVAVESPTLQHLQGITKEMLDILNDECIHSCQHLAQANPIKLLLRTRLEWKLILDFIDQAYLFNYVGEKMSLLRPLGIRGAIELATLERDLADTDDEVTKTAEAFLGRVGLKLGQDVIEVRNLITTLDEDIQVQFIWALWGEAAVTTDDDSTSD